MKVALTLIVIFTALTCGMQLRETFDRAMVEVSE